MSPKRDPKPEKVKAVKMLTEAFTNAKSTVFVDYSGMSVGVQQDLRTRLREAGGKMLVTKNTLIKIAGKNAGFPDDAIIDEVLSGQTAIILGGDDAVATIQATGKFNEETELASFKAGVVEGVFQHKDSLIKISKLPNKEELYSQVVGAISSPLYGLVGTLEGNLQKLIYILDQKAKGGE